MDKSISGYENIRDFLCNIRGNYRNSIYVTCTVCKYKKTDGCKDFLVSFNEDGKPAFISVKDADYIFGVMTDKSECMSEMSNAMFGELFRNYIKEFETGKETVCPYIKIIGRKQEGLSENE